MRTLHVIVGLSALLLLGACASSDPTAGTNLAPTTAAAGGNASLVTMEDESGK